jgi:hypothetical protein
MGKTLSFVDFRSAEGAALKTGSCPLIEQESLRALRERLEENPERWGAKRRALLFRAFGLLAKTRIEFRVFGGGSRSPLDMREVITHGLVRAPKGWSGEAQWSCATPEAVEAERALLAALCACRREIAELAREAQEEMGSRGVAPRWFSCMGRVAFSSLPSAAMSKKTLAATASWLGPNEAAAPRDAFAVHDERSGRFLNGDGALAGLGEVRLFESPEDAWRSLAPLEKRLAKAGVPESAMNAAQSEGSGLRVARVRAQPIGVKKLEGWLEEESACAAPLEHAARHQAAQIAAAANGEKDPGDGAPRARGWATWSTPSTSWIGYISKGARRGPLSSAWISPTLAQAEPRALLAHEPWLVEVELSLLGLLPKERPSRAAKAAVGATALGSDSSREAGEGQSPMAASEDAAKKAPRARAPRRM